MGMYAKIDLTFGYHGASSVAAALMIPFPSPEGNEVHVDWDTCAKILATSHLQILGLGADMMGAYWSLVAAINSEKTRVISEHFDELMDIADEGKEPAFTAIGKHFDLCFI